MCRALNAFVPAPCLSVKPNNSPVLVFSTVGLDGSHSLDGTFMVKKKKYPTPLGSRQDNFYHTVKGLGIKS